jgi:hypothetical protein
VAVSTAARATIRTLALLAVLASSGCPGPPPLPGLPQKGAPAAKKGAPVAGCRTATCTGVEALVAAVSAYGNVRHDFLLDTASALAPGRGLERGADGTYVPVPTACARPRPQQAPPKAVPSGESGAPAVTGAGPPRGEAAIDFRYVGVAVDSVLVGGDVDLAGYFAAGGSVEKRRVRLLAMALVADDDPQFFEASEAVTPAPGPGGACSCGRATHFVGAAKRGAMVSYEMDVTSIEGHGSALGLFQARLAKGDESVAMTTIGELSIAGLDPGSPGKTASTAMRFEVKKAVPFAYAVYPVADVCRFSFPEPELAPLPLDLGVLPYGMSLTRPLHIQNRAAFDVLVTHGGRELNVPAFGSAELPMIWTPEGSAIGCERQRKEETLAVRPRDAKTPATPRERTVAVPLTVVTGMPSFSKHEPVSTGHARAPDYDKASVDWTCPAGYVVEGCETQLARCLSPSGSCMSHGYRLTAEEVDGRGCRFRCSGPKSTIWGDNGCDYTAAMTCALSCR